MQMLHKLVKGWAVGHGVGDYTCFSYDSAKRNGSLTRLGLYVNETVNFPTLAPHTPIGVVYLPRGTCSAVPGDTVKISFSGASLVLPHLALNPVVHVWLTLWSRSKVEVDDVLAIWAPKSVTACQSLVQAVAGLAEEIKALQEEIKALENRLNDQVSVYYGLDEKDRGVIKGFLSRF